jgi:hypothetical protein
MGEAFPPGEHHDGPAYDTHLPPPPREPVVGPPPDVETCDWCGSTDLWWRNCKLLCRGCSAIVKSCADL